MCDSLEYTMSGSHDPLFVNENAPAPVAYFSGLRMRQSQGYLEMIFVCHQYMNHSDIWIRQIGMADRRDAGSRKQVVRVFISGGIGL